jgi:hypothetical protein
MTRPLAWSGRDWRMPVVVIDPSGSSLDQRTRGNDALISA